MMNSQQVNLPFMQIIAQIVNTHKPKHEPGFQQLLDHCARVIGREPSDRIEWERSFLNEGGPDPLRYVDIFKNEGDPKFNVPRHWHYVGFGLSDIHGYKKFSLEHEAFRHKFPDYALMTQSLPELYPLASRLNGFGFELTFRLKCESDAEWDAEAPRWPRKIMQDLARYVFQTRNTFSVGDHAAWNCSLDSDGQDHGSSRVRHLLMALDPQLQDFTPHYENQSMGKVTFIQMVGVCEEELQAAREWNVGGILDIMREREETGGPFLVTDMRRGETIFESNLDNRERVERGICTTGSNMVQVTVWHKSKTIKPNWYKEVEKSCNNDDCEDRMHDDEDFVMNVDENLPEYPVRTPSRMSQGSESALRIENVELYDTRYPTCVYILLKEESARVLPIMLKGRLAHSRPFSLQSFEGDSTITFIPEGSTLHSLVGPDVRFASQAHWLQIYVSSDLREQMWEAIKSDFSGSDYSQGMDDANNLRLPKNYSWPEFNLYLTVVRDSKSNGKKTN